MRQGTRALGIKGAGEGVETNGNKRKQTKENKTNQNKTGAAIETKNCPVRNVITLSDRADMNEIPPMWQLVRYVSQCQFYQQ